MAVKTNVYMLHIGHTVYTVLAENFVSLPSCAKTGFIKYSISWI